MKPNPSSRHLRDAPPRHIDLFTEATVLFGGGFQFTGWFFFFIGSLFAWGFLPPSELKFCFENVQAWREVTGQVVTVDPINATVNDVKMYRLLHSFEVDGERFTGKSYTCGQQHQGGEQVTVRYAATDPKNSYVLGVDRAVFPVWVAFVLIFPLLGLGFVVVSMQKNLNAVKLLENGTFTRGKLVSKEDTSMKVDNQRVYRYQFEFAAGGQNYLANCKTYLADRVEDEEREIILYNHFDPTVNVVYDAAPMPHITDAGNLEPASTGQAVKFLLPLLSVGVNLYFLMAGPSNFAG